MAQQLERILQLFRGKVGIALGHDQGLMTQEFLQCLDVDSPHGQMAGASVTEVVGVESVTLAFLHVEVKE
jgi:hypothetical protein